MGRKAKFSFETRLDIVLRCLKGQTTANHEAKVLGINRSRVSEWISLYQSLGEDGLITTSKYTFLPADKICKISPPFQYSYVYVKYNTEQFQLVLRMWFFFLWS